MSASPWDALLAACQGASTAVIAAPYIKVDALTKTLDALRRDAAIECFTRWNPEDILSGVSDLECRALVVERGGKFRLHNRLHAKYFRFGQSALVGSANLTASGLSYAHRGNLEILCEPGTGFDADDFERTLRRESRDVTDAEFLQWRQFAEANQDTLGGVKPVDDASLDDWHPQTREPAYLWISYTGRQANIPSSEQIPLAAQDLQDLNVPPGMSEDKFYNWIRMRLLASPFMNSVRRLEASADEVAWRALSAEWDISMGEASRRRETAQSWMRRFASE